MLEDEDIYLLSLRDSKGPCVNMTVREGEIVECEGRKKYPPDIQYAPALQKIAEHFNCGISPKAVSPTRLIRQQGKYWNIFNLPKDFRVDGDITFRFLDDPVALPAGLQVSGGLVFEYYRSSIVLGEGLKTKSLSFVLCHERPVIGSGLSCELLELDFIPDRMPENAHIDKVIYTSRKTHNKHTFSGAEFAAFVDKQHAGRHDSYGPGAVTGKCAGMRNNCG